MALNAEDRTYISKLNDDTKKHIEEIHDLKMDLILKELSFIKEQTTKTNGTVILHSKEISELQKQVIHTKSTCPNQQTIETLVDESQDDKSKKKVYSNQRRDLVLIITISGVVFAIIEGLLRFFANKGT